MDLDAIGLVDEFAIPRGYRSTRVAAIVVPKKVKGPLTRGPLGLGTTLQDEGLLVDIFLLDQIRIPFVKDVDSSGVGIEDTLIGGRGIRNYISTIVVLDLNIYGVSTIYLADSTKT